MGKAIIFTLLKRNTFLTWSIHWFSKQWIAILWKSFWWILGMLHEWQTDTAFAFIVCELLGYKENEEQQHDRILQIVLWLIVWMPHPNKGSYIKDLVTHGVLLVDWETSKIWLRFQSEGSLGCILKKVLTLIPSLFVASWPPQGKQFPFWCAPIMISSTAPTPNQQGQVAMHWKLRRCESFVSLVKADCLKILNSEAKLTGIECKQMKWDMVVAQAGRNYSCYQER